MQRLNNIPFEIILLLWIVCSCQLSAQEEDISMSIDKMAFDAEEGLLNFWVKCQKNGKLYGDIHRSEAFIYEKSNESNHLQIDSIKKDVQKKTMTKDDSITIVFLLDVSKKMDDNALKKGSKLIKEIVRNEENNNCEFYLTTFSNQTHSQLVTSNNIEQALKLKKTQYSPDLFSAFIEQVKSLKYRQGNKILFVLSSGENDTLSSIYNNRIPFNDRDIESQLSNRTDSLRIILGDLKGKTNPLRKFTKTFSYVTYLPAKSDIKDYSEEIRTSITVSNQFITAVPESPIFKGEKRTYIVRIKGGIDSIDFAMGSAVFPIDGRQKTSVSWLLLFLMGLLLLLFLLLIGTAIIPFIREHKFKNKYVRRYIEEKNRRRNDPYYNIPIEHGVLVVDKCRQLIPFDTWKEIGWQCPNYPDCMNQNCSGAGAPDTNDFFSMKGVYLKLNWMLFGAVGGFLAWLILSLSVINKFEGISELIMRIAPNFTGGTKSREARNLLIDSLSNNLLLAVAAGTGLTLMLALMEERRSSNQYSRWESFIKVLIRTIAGVIISCVVFIIGFYIQQQGVPPFFTGLISWFLFGLGLGYILSIRSSISVFNGMTGGILSSVSAFVVFWMISNFTKTDFLSANLVSMILQGGVMGAIIVSVVTALEDYELEVIAPVGYHRTIPISKWLKSSIGVTIGKSPSSYIYIKWVDTEVKPEHAELFAEDGKIFIRPIAEVLLNGKIVGKPTRLKNGDIFQLGRSSSTQFRYVEK